MQSQKTLHAVGLSFPGQPLVHSIGELPGRMLNMKWLITTTDATATKTHPKKIAGNLWLEIGAARSCLENGKMCFNRSKSQTSRYRFASIMNVVMRVPSKRT